MILLPTRAAVIVGGWSLRGRSFKAFPQEAAVVVNGMWRACPRAAVVYWSDAEWFREQPEVVGHAGLKVTSDGLGPRAGVEEWTRTGVEGLELAHPRSLRHGANSGYAAINVAFQLGAREVYLFGFDFRDNPDGVNHHAYPEDGRPNPAWAHHAPRFRTMRWKLSRDFLRIWNATPGSGIDAFEHIAPERAEELLREQRDRA